MARSLEQYAKETPVGRPGKPCWACTIPEVEEVNKARRDGVAITIIRSWLVEERGYDAEQATKNRLCHHFSNERHHLLPKAGKK